MTQLIVLVTLTRIAREVSLNQSSTFCDSDSACLPDGIDSAPTNLVRCDQGMYNNGLSHNYFTLV